MTSSNFNRPGAVDLSTLAQQSAQPAPGGGSTGSYVVDLTEQNLQEVMGKSVQHVVLVEVWSARAGAEAYSRDLAELAEEFAGKFLLARVNADEQGGIVQALQIRAVPTLLALIGGQAAPLAEGPQPREQLKQVLDQVMQMAAANGIIGRAEPVHHGATGEEDAGPDPRFAAADAALERGDFAAAVDEFDALLQANPNDHEAAAGKAQAGLLARATTHDPHQVTERIKADPSDLEAHLAAADLEMAQGEADAAFDRLLTMIRATSGDDRDRLRVRLLELFETLGAADPRVQKARRALTTALF